MPVHPTKSGFGNLSKCLDLGEETRWKQELIRPDNCDSLPLFQMLRNAKLGIPPYSHHAKLPWQDSCTLSHCTSLKLFASNFLMMTVFHNSKALLKTILCAPIRIEIFVPLSQNIKKCSTVWTMSVSKEKQQIHTLTEEIVALFLYLIIIRQRCMLPYFAVQLE